MAPDTEPAGEAPESKPGAHSSSDTSALQTGGVQPQVLTPLDVLNGLNESYGQVPRRPAASFAIPGQGADIPGTMQGVVKSLTTAFQGLAQSLQDFATNISSLEVETFAVPDLSQAPSGKVGGYVIEHGQLMAWTRIDLDGDLQAAMPGEAGRLNETLWNAHKDLVDLAQSNRAEMMKVAVDALVTLIMPTKVG